MARARATKRTSCSCTRTLACQEGGPLANLPAAYPSLYQQRTHLPSGTQETHEQQPHRQLHVSRPRRTVTNALAARLYEPCCEWVSFISPHLTSLVFILNGREHHDPYAIRARKRKCSLCRTRAARGPGATDAATPAASRDVPCGWQLRAPARGRGSSVCMAS